MNKVYIGKIVNTHGVKGELRIRSDFEFKDKVFIVNNMVLLDEYKNINDVLFLVGKNVYFDKDKLNLNNDEELDKDLLDYKVIINDSIGKIEEIIDTPNNKVLRIKSAREYLVPYNEEFVIIDRSKKEVVIKLIDGM